MAQIPWNRGRTGVYSEETRRKISASMTGRTLSKLHKKRIAISQKKRLAQIKQCSQCSVKSKWVYNVRMPFSEYVIQLCDEDLVSQYNALSLEDKRKVEIIP
jgi:hypothetical protein